MRLACYSQHYRSRHGLENPKQSLKADCQIRTIKLLQQLQSNICGYGSPIPQSQWYNNIMSHPAHTFRPFIQVGEGSMHCKIFISESFISKNQSQHYFTLPQQYSNTLAQVFILFYMSPSSVKGAESSTNHIAVIDTIGKSLISSNSTARVALSLGKKLAREEP